MEKKIMIKTLFMRYTKWMFLLKEKCVMSFRQRPDYIGHQTPCSSVTTWRLQNLDLEILQFENPAIHCIQPCKQWAQKSFVWTGMIFKKTFWARRLSPWTPHRNVGVWRFEKENDLEFKILKVSSIKHRGFQYLIKICVSGPEMSKAPHARASTY